MDALRGRVPKPYRLRLHRLKNLYRKLKRQEPEFVTPATDAAAEQAIALLENALREAGVPVDHDRSLVTPRRRRGEAPPAE